MIKNFYNVNIFVQGEFKNVLRWIAIGTYTNYQIISIDYKKS
jgi:hypothetical protein